MDSIGLVEIVDKGMVVRVDTTVVDSVAVELDSVVGKLLQVLDNLLEPDTADQPVELEWHQSISQHQDLRVFPVIEPVPNL